MVHLEQMIALYHAMSPTGPVVQSICSSTSNIQVGSLCSLEYIDVFWNEHMGQILHVLPFDIPSCLIGFVIRTFEYSESYSVFGALK